MTKKEFSNHLSNHWYLYLLSFVLLMFLSSWGIRMTAAPTKKEKVSIYLVAYGCKEDELYNKLNENREEYLKKIELNYYSQDNEYLYVFTGAYYGEVDIAIVPESLIEGNGIGGAIILNDVTLDGVIDNETKYKEIEGNYCGILVHEAGSETGILDEYITYSYTDPESGEVKDENYYLIINKKSYHMGELNNSEFDGGIQLLKEIFGNED